MWKVYVKAGVPATLVTVMDGDNTKSVQYAGEPPSYTVEDRENGFVWDGSHATTIKDRACTYALEARAIEECARAIYKEQKGEQ